MKTNNVLYKYARNNTSQYGEDGIIDELFRRTNILGGNILDIGAADGKWFSNSFSLLQRGFSVYGIERSVERFKKMVELSGEYKNLHPVRATVTLDESSEGHINKILDRHNLPKNFELITIDIDSIDAWVLKDIDRFPKIVIVEIEPSIYPLKEHWHDPNGSRETNPPQNQTGFYPIYKIANKKGYRLIGHTVTNLFFLRTDMIDILNWPEVTGVDEFTNFNPIKLSVEDKKRWAELQGV